MFISRIDRSTKAQDFKQKSLQEVADFTLKYDWSPFTFKDGYRHGTSWASCDVMVLDIDNDEAETCTIEQAKELFKEYNYLIVTTKSHQILKNKKTVDRFRVILPLSETILDKDIYKNTWYYLSNKYRFIDTQCKDFARFYYRSKEFVEINEGKCLDPVKENVIPKALEKAVVFNRPQIVTPTTSYTPHIPTLPSRIGQESKVNPQSNLRMTKSNLHLVKSKGKPSLGTFEFIANGAEEGKRNISCFKAAKDLQQQLYSEEETIEMLLRSKSVDADFTEEEVIRTVHSAYSNDPKYDPRGISEKRELIASNISDIEDDPDLEKMGAPINGTDFWDVTESGWRKGEALGIIAAPGSGKSSVSLKIIKDIIFNNQDNNDIHFFFTLEMPKKTIVKRWHKLVGRKSELSKRLYVIDNKMTEERITWQHIVRYVQDTCRNEGKTVGAIVVDHMMILSDKIDTTQEPSFDVSTDVNSGRGKIKTISTKEMCRLINVVAQYLNCFLIIQNQGTKISAGEGDTPLGLHAGYGAADFAWFCDYIFTVWQPLSRVQNDTYLTASGWQYNKIREKGVQDLVKIYSRNSIYYDVQTGDFRPLNALETDEFNNMAEKANALRRAEAKQEITKYSESKSRNNFQKLLTSSVEKKNETK